MGSFNMSFMKNMKRPFWTKWKQEKKNTEALANDDYLNLIITYADQFLGLKTFKNEYSFLISNSQRYFSPSKRWSESVNSPLRIRTENT